MEMRDDRSDVRRGVPWRRAETGVDGRGRAGSPRTAGPSADSGWRATTRGPVIETHGQARPGLAGAAIGDGRVCGAQPRSPRAGSWWLPLDSAVSRDLAHIIN